MRDEVQRLGRVVAAEPADEAVAGREAGEERELERAGGRGAGEAEVERQAVLLDEGDPRDLAGAAALGGADLDALEDLFAEQGLDRQEFELAELAVAVGVGAGDERGELGAGEDEVRVDPRRVDAHLGLREAGLVGEDRRRGERGAGEEEGGADATHAAAICARASRRASLPARARGGYGGSVADKPLSMSKVVAGVGGALLVASFFLPLVALKADGRTADDFFGVGDLRREIERSRDLEGVRPLIEPALQEFEAFAASPSLRNFSSLIASANKIVGLAVQAGVTPPEARQLPTVLSATRWGLWLLPLVGAIQALAPALTLFRGYAGFFGLVARFGFGLLFALIALVPLVAAPVATQAYIGSAVYVALAGGLLMMLAGVLGVTRGNWIFVLLAQGGILGCVVYGIKTLVALAER